jgi:hypothetical protein
LSPAVTIKHAAVIVLSPLTARSACCLSHQPAQLQIASLDPQRGAAGTGERGTAEASTDPSLHLADCVGQCVACAWFGRRTGPRFGTMAQPKSRPGDSRMTLIANETRAVDGALTEDMVPHLERTAAAWSNGVDHDDAWPMKLVGRQAPLRGSGQARR